MTDHNTLLRRAYDLGFSDRDVARLVRVTPQAVSSWRHGVYDPTPARMERVVQVLALLGGITPEQRNRFRNGKARRAWIKDRLNAGE